MKKLTKKRVKAKHDVIMRVCAWNKMDEHKQDEILLSLMSVIGDLQTYRKTGIIDEFTAIY